MVRVKKLKKEPGINITFSLEDPEGLPWTEAPEGLVPINDTGLYVTPDEPADPRDCDRYPDSIYCGNPFTLAPAALEPEFILDECNVGVQLSGAIGFIRVPPVALVWRKPECRNPPPPKPFELPQGDFESPPIFPANNCGRSIAIAVVTLSYESVEEFDNIYSYAVSGLYPGYHYAKSTFKSSVSNIEFPYTGDELSGNYDANGAIPIWAKVTLSYSSSFAYNEVWGNSYRGGDQSQQGSSTSEGYLIIPVGENIDSDEIAFTQSYAFIAGIRDIKRQVLERFTNYSRTNPHTGATSNVDGYRKETKIHDITVKCLDFSNTNNPPLSTKPPKNCCMTCCPTNNNNDDLVRLLIDKVDKLSKVVGVDEYPASLPASLISKDEGFLGNLIPNANKEIPNLTQFLAWYVERFDEVLGQWEIPIEIKDSDPSKPGDQPLGVKLPNMAEAIGEMFSLAFQTNLNSEVLLNFAVRNAAENMTDKQQNFITYKLLQSLTDWVGYKQKDTKEKMPMLFTLGKTRYDEILKESEVEVPCTEFDDKFGLEADLMRFREAVSILQAVHKKKIDPNGDIKGQILKYLLDTFASTKKVNGDDEDDMNAFIQQVEEGFWQVAGVTDPLKPYGRDYEQRPRIRDLTKLQPPSEQ